MKPMRIAVVATSSAVPQVELGIGVAHLRSANLLVDVLQNCSAQSFIFAGDDQQRADEFYAAAMSADCEVLWCACGGYGSSRMLPLLENLAETGGKPRPKLLIGFSDVTAIMSFARDRWGWKTTHAPMVISRGLRAMDAVTLRAIAGGERLPSQWGSWPLRWITPPPIEPIQADLIGGNLSVWNSLTGTPYAESAKGKILFLEDVDEAPYRIDRMMNQLHQSGRLDGVAAIVLGGFTDCEDRVSQVMSAIDPTQRVPLRPAFSIDEAMAITFANLGMPVAAGLPVGHGNNSTPLPMGAGYQLGLDGVLTFICL